MRKFHDEKQFGGYQHAQDRDQRAVHGGFFEAVNNRAAKKQPAIVIAVLVNSSDAAR
jgi:hypothetical protein